MRNSQILLEKRKSKKKMMRYFFISTWEKICVCVRESKIERERNSERDSEKGC